MGRKKQKARTFKQKKTFNLGTKEQNARTIKQKKLFNLSRTEHRTGSLCVCLFERTITLKKQGYDYKCFREFKANLICPVRNIGKIQMKEEGEEKIVMPLVL